MSIQFIKRAVLFAAFLALITSGTVMALSILDSIEKEDMQHEIVASCFEGYAVGAFLHGGSWSFAQVFERDGKGNLRPVRCGKGPFSDSHWK